MDAKTLYENLDDDSRRQIRRLAEEIKEQYQKGSRAGEHKGKVILFLGAAVNYHAPNSFSEVYSSKDRPPLANELVNLYIDDLCSADRTEDRKLEMKSERLPLSWVSQLYEANFDRHALIKKLASFIDGKKPSAILKALAKMPFKYIITTNYDNLFEEALMSTGKGDFHKGTYKSNGNGAAEYTTDVPDKEVSVNRPFLYKLHGDIRNVFDNDIEEYISKNDSIVITEEDYLHFILRMSQVVDNKERDDMGGGASSFYPIPQSVNRAFNGLNGNTFLFVGYGLRDYNLRLIFKTTLWKKDNNVFQTLQKWSIDSKPDSSIKNIWVNEYKFTFIEHDIWCAIPYLYKELFSEEMPLE